MAGIGSILGDIAKETGKTAGKGFLEGALGGTVGGAIGKGFSGAGTGATETPTQSALTGDATKDIVNAVRDFQKDYNKGSAGSQQTNAIMMANAELLGHVIKENKITNNLLKDLLKKEFTVNMASLGGLGGLGRGAAGLGGIGSLAAGGLQIAGAGAIGGTAGYGVGYLINEALKPLKRMLGYTADKYPEMAKWGEEHSMHGYKSGSQVNTSANAAQKMMMQAQEITFRATTMKFVSDKFEGLCCGTRGGVAGRIASEMGKPQGFGGQGTPGGMGGAPGEAGGGTGGVTTPRSGPTATTPSSGGGGTTPLSGPTATTPSSGGGGTTPLSGQATPTTAGSRQSVGAGGKYSAAQAAALIRKVGGTPEEAALLGAISQPESSGNPGAHNPRGKDDSYGLWQINMRGAQGPERLKKYGLSSNEQLYDPETNAKVALDLLRSRRGANNWSTYQSGAYKPYVQGAQSGATGGARMPAEGATPAPARRPMPNQQVPSPREGVTGSPSVGPSTREVAPVPATPGRGRMYPVPPTGDVDRTSFNRMSGSPGAGLVGIKTPFGPATVHESSAAAYQGYFNDLAQSGAPIGRLGSYSDRKQRWSSRPSQHAFGNAIDIDDRLGWSPEMQQWINNNPGAIDKIGKKWGMKRQDMFSSGRRDPNHVEFGGVVSPEAQQEIIQAQRSGAWNKSARPGKSRGPLPPVTGGRDIFSYGKAGFPDYTNTPSNPEIASERERQSSATPFMPGSIAGAITGNKLGKFLVDKYYDYKFNKDIEHGAGSKYGAGLDPSRWKVTKTAGGYPVHHAASNRYLGVGGPRIDFTPKGARNDADIEYQFQMQKVGLEPTANAFPNLDKDLERISGAKPMKDKQEMAAGYDPYPIMDGAGVSRSSAYRNSLENYYGKKISDNEFDMLTRAIHAESSYGKVHPEEAAMITGSILNRARERGGITEALHERKQFQSVTGKTGTRFNPSREFREGPQGQRVNELHDSIISRLHRVPKSQIDFTSDMPGSRGLGWHKNLEKRPEHSVYGHTMFGEKIQDDAKRLETSLSYGKEAANKSTEIEARQMTDQRSSKAEVNLPMMSQSGTTDSSVSQHEVPPGYLPSDVLKEHFGEMSQFK